MKLRTTRPVDQIRAKAIRRQRPRRPPQCKACLRVTDELTSAGYCADEQACQERQPRPL